MANPLFYTEVKKIGDGTVYQVVDVQAYDTQFAKPVENIVNFSDEVSIELKKNLVAGNEVSIPVADALGDATLDDFTVTEPDDLNKYKAQKKAAIQNIFTFNLASLGGLTFFRVLRSFSVLASNGYFITDENREEKYLEIINTGDQDLISALEEYLDAYDATSPVVSMYNDLKQAFIDIDAATDEAGVDAAIHMFETAS